MTSYREFHRRSIEDREAFWRDEAALVDWQTPFTQVLDYSRPPFARWFVGGRLNLCHNAVDRHLAARGDQVALLYLSTETDERRAYTYRDVHAEVNRFAAVLRAQGVAKGDRVLIYMPMIAGGRVRDARVRAPRRDPLGGVRRLRCREPRHPHRRCAPEGDDHLRRGHARGQGRAVQASRRRGHPARVARRRRRC